MSSHTKDAHNDVIANVGPNIGYGCKTKRVLVSSLVLVADWLVPCSRHAKDWYI